MKYRDKEPFMVPVGQVNHEHPKAADLDELFPKKPLGRDPLDEQDPDPCEDSAQHGDDGCVTPGEWTRLVRETGLVEHVCQHGVGHPDGESIKEMEKSFPGGAWGVHGCDGCCSHESFPGRVQ